jgi:hypothetical protein
VAGVPAAALSAVVLLGTLAGCTRGGPGAALPSPDPAAVTGSPAPDRPIGDEASFCAALERLVRLYREDPLLDSLRSGPLPDPPGGTHVLSLRLDGFERGELKVFGSTSFPVYTRPERTRRIAGQRFIELSARVVACLNGPRWRYEVGDGSLHGYYYPDMESREFQESTLELSLETLDPPRGDPEIRLVLAVHAP